MQMRIFALQLMLHKPQVSNTWNDLGRACMLANSCSVYSPCKEKMNLFAFLPH
jgi:hypothetical protein